MKIIFFFLAALVSISHSLTDEEFEKLHKSLQPDPKETWRTIPWKISVLEAQNEASIKNKPIFIWAMDGHPMTCT